MKDWLIDRIKETFLMCIVVAAVAYITWTLWR